MGKLDRNAICSFRERKGFLLHTLPIDIAEGFSDVKCAFNAMAKINAVFLMMAPRPKWSDSA